MTAFLEWTPRETVGAAVPWAFARADRQPFGIAALWERPEVDAADDCFVLLTTPANEAVGHVHHRMAAMLTTEGAAAWLDPATNEQQARELLTPFPAAAMTSWRVSPMVNNVKHNRRELLDPVA